MQACIFNIQRFSLHDGPGVRTTVFFKGCPLRCAWCSNPESLSPRMQILWTETACVACGACEAACPENAIALSRGVVTVDHARCVACGRCVEVCPVKALAVSGEMRSLDETLALCLRDRDFYEESGGGVTLSGGEATMWGEFAAALLSELRKQGVHTALETNGFAGEGVFRDVAGRADLLLFDIKQHDDAKHVSGTGVSNAPILANLAWALAAGRDVLVRIPVIRGYNNSLDDARGFARLLRGMGVKRVQLLPFHQMGESKYAPLGMTYALRDRAPLGKEDVEDFRSVMTIEGLEDVLL